MPIDVQRALSAEIPDRALSWTEEEVILYHLGVGAGAQPIGAGELEYVLEDRLKVLPSFAVIPGLPELLASLVTLPGFDVDPSTILHGEQDIEIF